MLSAVHRPVPQTKIKVTGTQPNDAVPGFARSMKRNYGDAGISRLSDLVEFAYADRAPSFREAMYLRATRGGKRERERIEMLAARRILDEFEAWRELGPAEAMARLEEDPAAPFGSSRFTMPTSGTAYYCVAIRMDGAQPLLVVIEGQGEDFDLAEAVQSVKGREFS